MPKVKFDVMKIIVENKDIIVQKADKGNAVIILNKKDHVCKMKKVHTDQDKILNHPIHVENRIKDVENLRDKREIPIKQDKDSRPFAFKTWNYVWFS